MKLNTAVLFLIFNRPDTTALVFEAIKSARPPRLYIAADGPRKNRDHEQELCQNARALVEQIDWPCEVKKLYRANNLGCQKAVSEAIDWFFENEEMGIILEDDCLPSQDFFGFCESMLLHYNNNETIAHISGCNVLGKAAFNGASIGFTSYPLIWGWATWRRAWRNYRSDLTDYQTNGWNGVLATNLEHMDIRYFWHQQFMSVINGLSNTWDYQWCYTLLKQKQLAVVPAGNLIRNIGFGGNATHTQTGDNPYATIGFESVPVDINELPEVKRNVHLQRLQELSYMGGRTRAIKYYVLGLLKTFGLI